MTSVDLLWAVREIASRVELAAADVVEVIPTAVGSADITALVAERVRARGADGPRDVARRQPTRHEHMFALASDGCNSVSMPPTGSSSSSRSVAGRWQADEAARLVLKLGAAVPVGLARSLLDEAVRRRRAPALGRRPRRARRRTGRGAAARAGDVRRLRPRDDRAAAGHRAAVRDRRGARARARARGAVPDARESRARGSTRRSPR